MTGTRKIRIDQITDVMDEAAQLLVKVTTLEWTARVKKVTPVFRPEPGESGVGGRLRNSWQTDIKTYEGINK